MIATDIPLLHPTIHADFTWAGEPCAIHAQRKKAGELRMHRHWFYLRLPDGSYHEVQFHRLRQHLTHPPEEPTTICIAYALSREPGQTREHLENIARTCGL